MKTPSRPIPNPVLAALLLAFAVGPISCASQGFTPDESPMPAARSSLRPEYRVFYDALADYGDWKLIEPFGYVFRPRVNFDAWQPYGDGFWAPTDIYGWVWVSAEPFGWATYHYGRWLYDSYQGWVWVPGLDWAPAWVAWQGNDEYIGWAPLSPDDSYNTRAPFGGFLYARPNQLTSTSLKSQAVSGAKAGAAVTAARRIDNPGQADGVRFNKGPRLEAIERITGPLQRARIEDIIPADVMSVTRRNDGNPPTAGELPGLTKRAAESAAREARSARDTKSAPPAEVPMVRPLKWGTTKNVVEAARAKKAAQAAKADSAGKR